MAYDYVVTNFDRVDSADQRDQRWTFLPRLALRERLFLDLTYRYTSRQFDEVTPSDRAREFDRSEILLTVTFAPTFLF